MFHFVFKPQGLNLLEIAFYFIFLMHEEIPVVLAGWAELQRMLAVARTLEAEVHLLRGRMDHQNSTQTQGIKASSGIQNAQGGYLVAPQRYKHVIGFTSRH